MHEYSIVSALLARVEVEARARHATAVHGVRVGLGELSGVDPGLLETAYETFRERTICAGAALELRRVPARWVCPRCELTVEPGAPLRCALCGGAARLLQGDELVLERIDLELP
jgi:hydrogenase nickel incorporation protein HypA/HybF